MNLRERIQTELAGVEQVTKEQMAKIVQAEKDLETLKSAVALNVGRASGLRTALAMLDEPAIAEEEAKRAVDQINEAMRKQTAQQAMTSPLSVQALAKKHAVKATEPITVRGNEIAKPPIEKDHAQHLNCGNCGSRKCDSYCLDAPVR